MQWIDLTAAQQRQALRLANVPEDEWPEDEDYSTDAGLAPGEDIRNVLFNVAHPDHCGQFDGLDRWSVMDFDEARSRSDYWARVADRIANDQEAE